MKLIKSSEWIRLRGQEIGKNEICKVDTPVINKIRIFFVPQSDNEKEFFSIDKMLNFTGIPFGPISLDATLDWGWRFWPDVTEKHMEEFAIRVEQTVESLHKGEISLTKKKEKDILMN